MRRPIVLVALSLALAATGCRQEPATYPPECSNGPSAVRSALTQAPDGEVAIEGVKLSECLVRSNDAGPLASFGGSVVRVASELADRARAGDERAAMRLGYLRGALERGADPTVHDDLLFRLDQELGRVDERSAAYRRGYAAGFERG